MKIGKASQKQINYIKSLVRQVRYTKEINYAGLTIIQASYLIKKLNKIMTENVRRYYGY